MDEPAFAAHEEHMRYRWALPAMALAVLPALYMDVWLGLAVAIVAYVLAAKLANREMDRVFLIENLKTKVEPPKR
jgi:hypothetical protein